MGITGSSQNTTIKTIIENASKTGCKTLNEAKVERDIDLKFENCEGVDVSNVSRFTQSLVCDQNAVVQQAAEALAKADQETQGGLGITLAKQTQNIYTKLTNEIEQKCSSDNIVTTLDKIRVDCKNSRDLGINNDVYVDQKALCMAAVLVEQNSKTESEVAQKTSGLGLGGIIGIVVAIAVLILIIALVVWAVKRAQAKSAAAAAGGAALGGVGGVGAASRPFFGGSGGSSGSSGSSGFAAAAAAPFTYRPAFL